MDIIADRALDIELPGEPQKRVVRVLLGKPEHEGEAWRVPYEIHGPGEGEVAQRRVYGDDALQALAVALYILPKEMLRYERRGRLTDQGEVGFRLGPLPDEHPHAPVPAPGTGETSRHRAALVAVCTSVFAIMLASVQSLPQLWQRALLSAAAYVFLVLSIQFVIPPPKRRQ